MSRYPAHMHGRGLYNKINPTCIAVKLLIR